MSHGYVGTFDSGANARATPREPKPWPLTPAQKASLKTCPLCCVMLWCPLGFETEFKFSVDFVRKRYGPAPVMRWGLVHQLRPRAHGHRPRGVAGGGLGTDLTLRFLSTQAPYATQQRRKENMFTFFFLLSIELRRACLSSGNLWEKLLVFVGCSTRIL